MIAPARLAVIRMDNSVSSQPRVLLPTRPTDSSKPPASSARSVRMLMLAPIGFRT